MQEHADARKSTQQCQADQIRMLAMLEDALRVERLVQQHDIEIKEFREDHANLKATVESLKSPLEALVKDISDIKTTNNAIAPLLKQYNLAQTWLIRTSLFWLVCSAIYMLFGSNALKLITLILAAL